VAEITKAGRTLWGSVVAALIASVCCVGPLVLLVLGIGGAWVANLTALEPYRPIFVIATLVLLGLAFRKLYLAAPACAPGDACAVPAGRRRQRLLFWVIAVPVLLLLAFPWYAPIFY